MSCLLLFFLLFFASWCSQLNYKFCWSRRFRCSLCWSWLEASQHFFPSFLSSPFFWLLSWQFLVEYHSFHHLDDDDRMIFSCILLLCSCCLMSQRKGQMKGKTITGEDVSPGMDNNKKSLVLPLSCRLKNRNKRRTWEISSLNYRSNKRNKVCFLLCLEGRHERTFLLERLNFILIIGLQLWMHSSSVFRTSIHFVFLSRKTMPLLLFRLREVSWRIHSWIPLLWLIRKCSINVLLCTLKSQFKATFLENKRQVIRFDRSYSTFFSHSRESLMAKMECMILSKRPRKRWRIEYFPRRGRKRCKIPGMMKRKRSWEKVRNKNHEGIERTKLSPRESLRSSICEQDKELLLSFLDRNGNRKSWRFSSCSFFLHFILAASSFNL